MKQRPGKKQPGRNLSVYGPDQPIDSIDAVPIDPRNSTQFGAMFPDEGKYSMGPWHELRRQMMLFALHVRTVDGQPMSPRRDPGPDIEWRCDAWIVMCLRMITDRKRLIPPPTDLRPWLVERAMMALSFINFEIRNQDKMPPPDMYNNFRAEIGTRLIIFWQEQGKERWLKTPPDSKTVAE